MDLFSFGTAAGSRSTKLLHSWFVCRMQCLQSCYIFQSQNVSEITNIELWNATKSFYFSISFFILCVVWFKKHLHSLTKASEYCTSLRTSHRIRSQYSHTHTHTHTLHLNASFVADVVCFQIQSSVLFLKHIFQANAKLWESFLAWIEYFIYTFIIRITFANKRKKFVFFFARIFYMLHEYRTHFHERCVLFLEKLS